MNTRISAHSEAMPAVTLSTSRHQLDDDMILIEDTASRFARERLADGVRRREADRSIPAALQAEFEELGLHSLDLSESLGGLGLGAVARVLVNRTLGLVDPGTAVALDRASLALGTIERFAGPEAAARFASTLADPNSRAILAVINDTGLDGTETMLSLDIPWVPAARVDLLVLLNLSGIWVVTQGIRLDPVRGGGLRAANASRLTLESAPVAASWHSAGRARHAFGHAYLYGAALIAGSLEQACDVARDYALTREAFGRPIAHHQAIAFMLGDMRAELETAKLMLMDAAHRIDADPDDIGPAAASFVECAEAARFIAPQAVQILGGSGFMQDYLVEKIMRETKLLGLWMGGADRAAELSLVCALEARKDRPDD